LHATYSNQFQEKRIISDFQDNHDSIWRNAKNQV
jgi:hypothetical protein